MRYVKRGAVASRFLGAVLAAVAMWACNVEDPGPLSSTLPPRLEPLGSGVGGGGTCDTKMLEQSCAGHESKQCCLNYEMCSSVVCERAGDECRDNVCYTSCAMDSDCAGMGGSTAMGDSVCVDGICVISGCRDIDPEHADAAVVSCPPGQKCINDACFCTSNRGCDEGYVCDGDAGAAKCVPPICNGFFVAGACDVLPAQDSTQGCSCSVGAASYSSGFILTGVAALALAGALALRRRRSE